MFKRSICPLFLFLILSLVAAGTVTAKGSGDGVWREINDTSSALRSAERTVVPDHYRTFNLNQTLMKTILESAPAEFRDQYGMSNTIVSLPMPDGTFERFRIEQSLVVEPGLVEKFPELAATYRGQGIDDPTATVRLDFMPSGFHSMILSTRGTFMVDPYAKNDSANYISYLKSDVQKTSDFSCDTDRENAVSGMTKASKADFKPFVPQAVFAPSVTSGTQLRTYRLALAATNEYAMTVGGNTIAGTLAAQATVMTRVNGIYERDLAIRMVVVANNNLIVYAGDQMCGGVACTGANDPYTNSSGTTMLTENQNNVNTVIGTANYDIGHVFSTGGGGVAGVGVPCGTSKARGVTGLGNPVGDPFAIDYVAHEMGHQWGGNHTFNGGSGSCGSGGQRSPTSAYEPGSGVTIMAYAGICGAQDLAGNSIDSFHVRSLEEIVAYSQTGTGNTCAATTATGNTPPVVTATGGTTFNIPRLTPFTLAATATDANGDTVTYDWQEYDLGPVTTAVPNTDSDGSARPIFRPYSPSSNGARTYPSNQFILNNANTPPNTTGGFLTGELLPAIARTMNFQVIARDNRANGGGINTATVSVVVAGTGPFAVTGPATGTTWFLNSNPVVTWNTGGSESAPINATNVRILLSTDGGVTFPTTLLASTPNDGSEAVVSPNLNSSTARIRIEPIGGIFFDVSDSFTISSQTASNGDLGGRITTAAGRGVGRVYVSITGGTLPGPILALTNSFGYFNFPGLSLNQTYTITPRPRKGTTFTPTNIVRSHTAAATDVNFTAN
ncbi:MAG: hypothetical protein HOP17_13920 [Acidobacteria bacterium]|nr:hypothetical protein [Acidobacteriota bacterium]